MSQASKFPPMIPVFYYGFDMVFSWNHRPKANNKTMKIKFATPKVGEVAKS